MKEISVAELKKLIDSKADIQLIDVRERHENEIATLHGKLIPMGTIPEHLDQISREKQVVVHCRSGKRSGDVINYLEKNHGFENLYNLKGGILAWSDEIDPSVPKY
jgi:rhodanese-related sulfurtransferase